MDTSALALSLVELVLAVLVGYALAAARRVPGPDPLALVRLQEGLDRLARAQEQVRREAQRGREDALAGLAGAAQDLQGRLAQAQRAYTSLNGVECPGVL